MTMRDEDEDGGLCAVSMSSETAPLLAGVSSDDAGSEDAGPEDAYSVGYGKPPLHSRFKPGQSGNPKGKPKARKSTKESLRAILNERIAVQTANGRKHMGKLEALLHTNLNKALKGDAKASELVFRIAREHGLDDEISEAMNKAQRDELSAEDEAILARMFSRVPIKKEVDA